MAGIGGAHAAARALATAVSEQLAQLTAVAGGGRPCWLDSRRALERAQVWRAEELLLSADPVLRREHALAALRMFALLQGVPLGQVADELLNGQLSVEQVRGQRR